MTGFMAVLFAIRDAGNEGWARVQESFGRSVKLKSFPNLKLSLIPESYRIVSKMLLSRVLRIGLEARRIIVFVGIHCAKLVSSSRFPVVAKQRQSLVFTLRNLRIDRPSD